MPRIEPAGLSTIIPGVSAGDRAPSPAIARTARNGRPAWVLQTERTAMLLSLGPGDALLLDHWGSTGLSAVAEEYLPHTPPNRPSHRSFLDGVPLAYPLYGDPSFKEPCLCVVYEDGTRIVRLELQEDRVAEADGLPTLELSFADPVYHLRVVLRFVVHVEHDLIARSARLENGGDRPVLVERALSAGLGLPPGRYEAWTLHGQWGREFGLERRPLQPGKFVTESRRGFTSQETNSWFAASSAGETDEHHGRVWFGALAWSGNWTIVFEVERNDALNVVAGINPFDSSLQLEPDEGFETPALICGYGEDGLGGAARLLHRYQAQVVLPERHRSTLRPILYNSWEATYFDVGAEQQIDLARTAAGLGVELFVVDDGWFGARDHDRAGLGDWVVNLRKFPRGLAELIDEVHRLGMQFGIWVEPEMVNPDSDLYRAHPDWTFQVPGREPTFVRNQLVLNFARQDVRENIFGQLERLLHEHAIDFVKWDHNRPYTEVGWPAAPRQRQREVWVRHVRGVYEVIGRLRARFPDLLMETCAGGGGRADLGILSLMDQVWTSDNTEAADRLSIQYGYSHAYAPRTMVCWVTDVPNHQTGRLSPLELRFHVAMQGVLGIGGNILRWSPDERARARELIEEYKRLRPIVQHGGQYWLMPPAPIGPCAVQYVSEDRRRTVVMLYQLRAQVGRGPRRVPLRGLEPTRRYRRVADGAQSTGAALMGAGLPITFGTPPEPLHVQDLQSRVELWEAVEA
jgi:alpha-galactosidase